MPIVNRRIPSAAKLYGRWQPQAESLKVIGQMVVGLLTVIGVAVAVIIQSVHPITASGAAEKLTAEVFAVTAAGLAAAAALELAYTLFTPGPDEALNPLLLGVSSTFLFLAVKSIRLDWQFGFSSAFFAAALYGLFKIKERFVDPWAAGAPIESTESAPSQETEAGHPDSADPETSPPDEESSGTQERVSLRGLAVLIPVIPVLLGPILYGVAAYGYDSFYFKLGVTPSEVGLGYTEILTSAIPALALLSLATLISVLIMAIALRFMPRLRKWLISHKATASFFIMALLIVAAVLYGVLGLGKDARAASVALANGREPESVRILGFTLVHLQAPRVQLEWAATASTGQMPAQLRSPGVQLYELGTQSRIVILALRSFEGRVVAHSVIMIPSNWAALVSNAPS
jgi:hypothetical protein